MTGSAGCRKGKLGAKPGETGDTPDGEGGVAKSSKLVGRRARLGAGWPAPALRCPGRGGDPAYPALAVAAASAWGPGRPFCAAGFKEVPGGCTGSGGLGARGAHAQVGGRKRSSEAWVRGVERSGAKKEAPSPLPPPFLPPLSLPPSRARETIPAPPQPRPRPHPGQSAAPPVSSPSPASVRAPPTPPPY